MNYSLSDRERLVKVETQVGNISDSVERIEGKLDAHVATHRNGHSDGSDDSHKEDIVVLIPKALFGRIIVWTFGIVGVTGASATGIAKALGII